MVNLIVCVGLVTTIKKTVLVKSKQCTMILAFVHSNEHRILNLEEILENNDYDSKPKHYNSHSIVEI